MPPGGPQYPRLIREEWTAKGITADVLLAAWLEAAYEYLAAQPRVPTSGGSGDGRARRLLAGDSSGVRALAVGRPPRLPRPAAATVGPEAARAAIGRGLTVCVRSLEPRRRGSATSQAVALVVGGGSGRPNSPAKHGSASEEPSPRPTMSR
jgi:hypothetical protein